MAALPASFWERFRELRTPQTAAMDRRIIWKQTLLVIKDYYAFGCGLGGYASVYLKYKSGMPLWSTTFVHNDYLQGLAELGIVGILLLVGLVAGWLAGKIVTGGGFGLIGDIAIGIVGALVGSWLFPRLGIHIGTGIVNQIIAVFKPRRQAQQILRRSVSRRFD